MALKDYEKRMQKLRDAVEPVEETAREQYEQDGIKHTLSAEEETKALEIEANKQDAEYRATHPLAAHVKKWGWLWASAGIGALLLKACG